MSGACKPLHSLVMTPLYVAANRNHVEVAETLLKHGANIEAKNNNDNTPLYYACLHNQVDLVEILLKQGADIEARNKASQHFSVSFHRSAGPQYGYTPLHEACLRNHVEVAETLLNRGADIDAKNEATTPQFGMTPLHVAADKNHVKVAETLLKHGADIEAKSNLGCTPLCCAYVYNHVGMLEVLMKKGADIVARDQSEHLAIVDMLLNHGVDADALNETNQSPLSYQLSRPQTNQQLIIRLLCASRKPGTYHSSNPEAQAVLLAEKNRRCKASLGILFSAGWRMEPNAFEDCFDRTPPTASNLAVREMGEGGGGFVALVKVINGAGLTKLAGVEVDIQKSKTSKGQTGVQQVVQKHVVIQSSRVKNSSIQG
ncbi:uncharacterized protein MONBRDRAFT_25353 [Monosiga brevicollis MX1]|uniref:Uncharacterized protein n=1 Tax=Monosiga brevicollis TaxID=81824 RepID=A9UZ58_MONBE|nr:uncharacterized protein MONBRDRAFT_25353 [Monosiga brevicollis MX1]EDQ89307.1 predicted protein [Monosiga brevicollis MX1]|eukprot:XP_001745883.1 hypothetical protein [Monosiga brevicollis MX1]